MEALKDMGQIKISSQKKVYWKIPNYYGLPQRYDTVIRSPHFQIDDRVWYMEVYPNGRGLHSSFGWFGLSVLNLNSESCPRNVRIGVKYSTNVIFSIEKSRSNGFYCCTRLIPTSLFNSWKHIFAPEGDLRIYLKILDKDDFLVDTIYFLLRADDVPKLFQRNFENVTEEACVQVEGKSELPMETTVGELDIDWEGVSWKVPNFSDLLHRYDTVIRSPRFHYRDSDLYMEVYPNGRDLYSSLGWFGIGICNLNCDSTLRCTNVKISEEAYEFNVKLKADSQNKGFYYCSKLLPTSLFKSWQDVIAPGGNLQLFFFFDDEDKTGNRTYMWILKGTMLEWYQQKFENADIVIEASTQTEEEIEAKADLKQTDGGASTEKATKTGKGVDKVIQDLKEILLNGNVSDIVLKVKSREYKAHRCILAARSPVFLAMVTHDTKEQNTGVVDISDLDPNAFQDFLNYLYTGSVSILTSENVTSLYTMADKYQVNELKESCKDLMMGSISIDNFCDVFTLSLQHDEKELKDACIHFFAENSLDIIETCKWQTFLSENPITGNELFIKHLKLNK